MRLLFFLSALFLVSSCTIVSTTNLPGKSAKVFPKGLIGKYDLKYPESMESMTEGTGVNSTVVITKTSLEITTGDQTSKMILNDSIYYSTVGKQGYLSLGQAPNFTVLRVVKAGKDFELYTMNIVTDASKDDLKAFFKEVKEEVDVDENGEESISYNVTLDDSKLDAYFKSEHVDKDPFKLVRKKNKG